MQPCDENENYIFVSYAHKDSEKVVHIIELLSAQGFNIWYDDGIDPGTEWDENIASHIVNCSYFIAFISENYLNSKNCKDELNYARDCEKRQLLVYLEEVDLPIGMAMRMNRLQAIWWYKYPVEDVALMKLLGAKDIGIASYGDAAADRAKEAYRQLDAIKAERKSKAKKVAIVCLVTFNIVCIAVVCLSILSKKSSKDSVARTDISSIEAGGSESNTEDSLPGQEIIVVDSQQLVDQGIAYLYGSDGKGQDSSKAYDLFKQAADLGNHDGIKYIAYCYNSGDGVERDVNKALEYYEIYLEKWDEAWAYEAVGNIYFLGEGIEKDSAKALEYYETSYQKGNKNSPNLCYRIGQLYEKGEGTAQNLDKAKEYYQLGADQGYANCQEALEALN